MCFKPACVKASVAGKSVGHCGRVGSNPISSTLELRGSRVRTLDIKIDTDVHT